jgi:PAS domain S-box-containing protein
MTNSDEQKKALFFDSIFSCSNEGIILVDPNGIILKINPAFTKIFGYEEDEMRGKPFYDLA